MGLSQAKFAELTKLRDFPERKGIPRSVLIGYESGKYKPGARELRILCDSLDMDIATLLYGSGKELEDDIERATAKLFSGSLDRFGASLRIGLGLARLKPHEQEAFGTLVLGMVLRTFKTPDEAAQLWSLADILHIDIRNRVASVTGDDESEARLARAVGEGGAPLDSLIQALEELVNQEADQRRNRKKGKKAP